MYKFHIIDQQSDRSQQALYQALSDYSEADTIKKIAASIDSSGITKLASIEFALDDFRAFPINTTENTILSKVYFDHQKENNLFNTKLASYLPKTENIINTHLNLFDIPSNLFERVQKEMKKQAEDFTPQYLIPSKNLCKVATAQDLTDASELFEKNIRSLDIPTRIEFSQNYVKIAMEVKHKQFSPQISKYAAELDSNLNNTRRFLELRAAAAQRKNLVKQGQEYIKLASQLGKVDEDATTKEELLKLAELIYSMDEKHGLLDERKMPCAYSSVFNKLADMDAVIKPQENVQAKTMSKADIIGKFGVNALSSVENQDGTINPDRVAEMNKLKNIFMKDQTPTVAMATAPTPSVPQTV